MSSEFTWVRRSLVAVAVAVAGWAGLPGAGGAEAQILAERESAVVANVVEAKGGEDFTPVEQAGWQALLVEQDLSSGDVLRTGAFGGLGIAFEDRTYVRLHANTQMEVADPGTGTEPKRFGLSIGRLWSRASRPDRPVIVETPSATAAIRGTDWFMEVLDDGTSRLVVLDGQVRFFNAFGDIPVDAGRSAIARPGAAPEFELDIVPVDRPRWALTPRSDWLSFLPFERAVERAAETPAAPVWSALANRQPRLAQAEMDGLGADANAGADMESARAIIDLMLREPDRAGARLSELAVSAGYRRLADAAAVGAAIDAAQFETALARLDAYGAAHGEDLASLALQAYLEAYAGRYDAARGLAGRVSEVAPEDWRRHLLTAQIAALQGDDAAFEQATSALVLAAPDAFETWHWRGIYLASAGAGSPSAVQAVFETAAGLNPEFVPAIVAVAQLQAASGGSRSALATLKNARVLDPSEPFTIAAEAFVYLTMDRLDLADAALAPVTGTPLALHPEIQSALSIRALMAGEADDASRATGTVIAAKPDRPGIAQLDAIAHWQAGRREVARKVIGNAVRLDPNEPVAARIASALAQDQYAAGDALRFAQAAWDAKQRNARAGLIQLPASQSGRIDIGAAFLNLGLGAQAEYYSSLARTQADPNSAFAYANIFPDGVARQSSTTVGLLLDPLAVTYPNRFVQFFRTPMVQQTADASATFGGKGASQISVASDSQTLIRTPQQPVSLAGFIRYSDGQGTMANSDERSGLLSLRAGTVRNGRHGLVGRLTVDYREMELPGSFGVADRDDDERNISTVVGLGYTFNQSWTDRWMINGALARGDRRFRNPSAFGSGLDPIEYSLVASLGLEAAQAFAARGLFDTTASMPGEAILFVDPPATVPVTRRVGEDLLPLTDDTDPVSRIEADTTLVSLQTRRIMRRNGADLSFGLEYGEIETETDTSEIVFNLVGAGAIGDFANMGEITTFDLGEPLAVTSPTSSRSTSLQAHVHGSWPVAPGWTAEAGVFPTLLRSRLRTRFLGASAEIEETSRTLDPRFGLAWRGGDTQLRVALQRTRLLSGVDTIAPLGTLGLLPNQLAGVTATRIDSAIVRVDHEARPDVFVFAAAEFQDMADASAGLAGERLERSAFFAPDASLAQFTLGTDVTIGDRLGVSASYVFSDGEIDSGAFAGRQLPVVPEHGARVGASWVDPRFFRLSGSLAYIGPRYGDGANLVRLDEAVELTAGVLRETRDKRWLFRLDGRATSADSRLAGDEHQVTLGVSRRW
ncbi:MAG: FecR domain-containing protein [Pseudomonadota bacterium]